MKVKLIISCLLISALIFYSFEKKGIESAGRTTTSEPPQSEFILGAMSNVFDNTMYNYLSDSLKFNMWHLYAGPSANYGWTYDNGNRMAFDSLGGNTSTYGPYIRDRISQNSQHNLMTLMTRPVITYFAYGQRSDYQMEESTKVDPYYFFYTYNYSRVETPSVRDIADNTQYGSGEYVKRCLYNRDNPGSNAGLIVNGLKGNKEQANTFWPIATVGDNSYDWYIMPRIRIDSAFANNVSNQNTEVCRIVITNWDGDSLTQILKVKHFKKELDSIYKGNYLERYNPYLNDSLPNFHIAAGMWFNPNQEDPFGHNDGKVDFKVYWYDKCDMWIDRIRVENQPARDLTTVPFQPYINQLNYEINDIALAMRRSINTKYEPYKFYIEEFEMNNMPTIGIVNNMIRNLTTDSMSLMVNYNYDLLRAFIPNRERYEFTADMISRYLIDSAKLREIFTESYGLEGWQKNDTVAGNNRESYNPPTLNYSGDYDRLNGRLVYKASTVEEYENWLQNKFEYGCNGYCQPITFDYMYKLSDEISRVGDVPFMYLLQAHSWNSKYHKLKEPTNEEISLEANLAISYGAKGIMYFAYNSDNDFIDTTQWSRGLTNPSSGPPYPPRYLNAYGQEKWKAIGDINEKIKILGPGLISFNNTNRKSYILRTKFSDLYSQTYFSDVITYRPFGGTPTCPEENPNSSVTGTYFECKEKRYLQVATFQNSEPNTKFFMIVNRRCSPFIDTINDDNNGGRRFLKIKLDSSSTFFSGFNNWSIYNLSNDSLIKTFDKNTKADINLGWYLPGEGKLYKLAPVMQEGGELVADESCFSSFTCNGEVYSEGFDIRLNPGTEISFSENGRLAMNGGSFISGYTESNQSDSPVTLKGLSTRKWKGVSFNNCDEVNVINTSFSDISPEESGAVQITNCLNTSFISSLFNSTDSAKTALSADYILNGGEWNVSLYLKNNQFINTVNSLKVISYGSTVIPVTIDGNSFAASVTGNNAVTLSNITAGIIKNNFISNYRNSMNMICCTADLYRNVITCSISNSVSISPSGMSCLNFGKSGDYYTGGINSIESDEANINTDNSDFNLNKGYNTFNIFNSSSSAYHFTGTFPESSGDTYLRAAKNCFQINSLNDNPLSSIVYNGTNLPVEFEFNPVNCDPFEPGEYTVLTVNGRNDTIYFENEPSGAGYKGGIQSNTSNPETESLNALYDSAKISARIRDYETAKLRCEEVLNSFADSIQAVNVISELYLSYLNTGNTGNRMSELESYLEAVILNHSENEALVNKCFYFIQKCKVSEREYLSAMTGFSQIVNQNPYSYEGLIASWDYAAVSLLAGDSGGTGAGKSGLIITNGELQMQIKNPEELREYSEEELMQIYVINDDPVLNTNKTEKTTITNTKATAGEDRKKIKLSVFNSLKAGNETDKDKMKILEEKDREGTAGEREKSDLRKMKTLREIIRLRKPADIREHILKVNCDLNRLSETTAEKNKVKYSSSLPEEYMLSQNYPNPFNPKTIISYELRITNFVKIRVYDVLGKEVAILVNEVQHPGTYEIEFNGNNLASGVYLCRMESGEFKDIKRMVLIK